jgi:hypothetical protein
MRPGTEVPSSNVYFAREGPQVFVGEIVGAGQRQGEEPT